MFKIPPRIEYIINSLAENGFDAYIVGGCVRDILLGLTPHDYDITTNATPNEIMSVFPHTVPTGIKHGTVTVLVENEPVEVTTFRCDGDYLDSRHPESVKFVRNLREDLSRRDFTVNAMAYNNTDGLCDLFGGQKDIENKTLRAVGKPEKRFKEDALRILRLFRFASTLNFKIEKNTFNAAIKYASLIKNVSVERIMKELKAAVLGENFKVISPLIECGGLSHLGLLTCPDFEKILKHKNNPNLCLYLLFNVNITDKLKLSNNEKDYINAINRLKALPLPQSKADIKHCLRVTNEKIIRDYLSFCGIDISPLNEIIQNREPYLIGHLKITGNDLIKLGYKGEEIGDILEKMQAAIINEPTMNTKARLLSFLNNKE